MSDTSNTLSIHRAVLAIAAAVLVVTLVYVLTTLTNFGSGTPKPKGKQYQAVFLTNGQVYFGKLTDAIGPTYTLKNVYYVQSNPQAAGTASPSPAPQLSLVQLGGEVHGPEDEMQIVADQVLFWENLKNDSKVVEVINQRNQDEKK